MKYPFDISFFTIYDGKLYAATSTDTGFVYRLDVPDTYSDDGVAYDSYMWSREFEGFKNQKENHKDFRSLKLTLGTLGDWNVGISYRLDSDISEGTRQTKNVSPGGGVWGTLVWGSGTWGGGILRKPFKIELGTASGVKIQFKFDNGETIGQAFKVLRGTLFYNDRGRR
jgi:hypothetical protein